MFERSTERNCLSAPPSREVANESDAPFRPEYASTRLPLGPRSSSRTCRTCRRASRAVYGSASSAHTHTHVFCWCKSKGQASSELSSNLRLRVLQLQESGLRKLAIRSNEILYAIAATHERSGVDRPMQVRHAIATTALRSANTTRTRTYTTASSASTVLTERWRAKNEGT